MQPQCRPPEIESLAVTAACRVRGIAYRAQLSEVSRLGCCAEMARDVAVPGERVLLQVGRLLVLPAVVRWVAGGRTGLEFSNPLHGAVLGQYARSPAEAC